jgi:MFS family permease
MVRTAESSVSSCALINPQLGLLNAIQNIGCLAAYPFSPYVSDGYGRRTAVALGAFIMCAATVLQTASQSVGMFIGARYGPSLMLNYAPQGLNVPPQIYDRLRPHVRSFGCPGFGHGAGLPVAACTGHIAVQHPMVSKIA